MLSKIIHPQLVVLTNHQALSCTPLSGIYEDNGGHRDGGVALVQAAQQEEP